MELETSRLYIRELRNNDWCDLKKIALDHQQSPYAIYDHPLPTSEEGIKEIVDFFIKRGLFFVVYHKETNEMIGYVSFQNKNNYLDIAYCIHKEKQRNGYAYESCNALMQYLSINLSIDGFTAVSAIKNIPSCKLLKKLGFILRDIEEKGKEMCRFEKKAIYIPKQIKSWIFKKTYTIDQIGMSGSKILMFDDMVLKIQDYNAEVESEITMMQWLEGKIEVPKVLCHIVEDDISYLLMNRIEGKMSCDSQYLENNSVLVDLLVMALKVLWQVNISDCPTIWNLDRKLARAKERVQYSLVDIENVDPNTFGEKGFKDPQDLYNWLVENQPEEDLVLSHGDFCLPNIFINEVKPIAYIDLGRMGIADRWQDIALCYRSLRDNMNGSYGGKVYEDFNPDILFEKLGIEKDDFKLKYYLLLDELF